MANINAQPNPEHQFKKGQSGNPKGRPKDLITKHLLRFAKAKENIIVEIKDEEGEIHKVKIANGQDVAMTIMNKAASGEGWAVILACDRIDGKVAQALEHTGKDGKELPPAQPIVNIYTTAPPLHNHEADVDA